MSYLVEPVRHADQAGRRSKIEAPTEPAHEGRGLWPSRCWRRSQAGRARSASTTSTRTEAHLTYAAKAIKPLMDEVRKSADALEAEVGDDVLAAAHLPRDAVRQVSVASKVRSVITLANVSAGRTRAWIGDNRQVRQVDPSAAERALQVRSPASIDAGDPPRSVAPRPRA